MKATNKVNTHMQLLEFFSAVDEDRYQTLKDKTRYDMENDTRKSKLTLEMINQLRLSVQARRNEKRTAMELYQKMYGGSIADVAEPTL